MANVNSPDGAKVFGHLESSSFNARLRPYTVLATDATALFVGDFVVATGTSGVSDQGQVLPVVTQGVGTEGSPSSKFVGVVAAFLPNSTYMDQTYRTASTLRTALVYDDPYTLFVIQANGVVSAADIGQNADIVVAAGDTIWGRSGMQLDISSKSSATKQLRILGLADTGNNELGAYAKLIAMINQHEFKSTTGT